LPEARRIVVATAGHVDHGKTSLIRALTGVDTDRLPEEKRRGISIELGFAELAGGPVSFIDVPGHERFVHTMIAGVGGVDALLLVVAADDSVMPQTREHLAVAAVLGIPRVLVALSKCDLVDSETLELAELEVKEVLAGLGWTAARIVRTSTATGQGVAELEQALRAMATEVPVRAASARLWLSVDRVFSVRGAGTIVTGTLTRGQLSEGEAIYVAREDGVLETACRGLETHGHRVASVAAPARVAINLARLPLEAVSRGDVITKDAELAVSRRLDVALRFLPGTAETLSRRPTGVAHIGTARALARIVRISDETAHLALDRGLPAEGGIGFVLRGMPSKRNYGGVLGGGIILDALAPRLPRRRDQGAFDLRLTRVRALASGDRAAGVLALLRARAPRSLVEADVERRLGLEPGVARSIFAGKTAAALRLGDTTSWIVPDAVDELTQAALRWLETYHAQSPHELGAPVETLRVALGRLAGRHVAEYTVERLIEEGRVRALDGGRVGLPAFAERSQSSHDEAIERVRAAVEAAALEGVSEHEITERTGLALDRARAALTELGKKSLARRLSGLWFGEKRLADLRAAVRAHLRKHPTMSVPAFKELFGVSRKQAIPLLEDLDHQGVTRRQGDDRVLGPAGEK
jgi:selenocysteine-specific elongation factor